jgi:hypothetical protein
VSNNEKNLYHVFPGQGLGRRRRSSTHLLVGIVVALIAVGLLGAVIYAMEP